MPWKRDARTDDAFTLVVEREWTTLVRVAQRWSGPGDDIEDVVQDAIIRTYQAWKDGKVRDHLAGYLTRTVRNVAVGLRRRQLSESRALDRLLGLQPSGLLPVVEDGPALADDARVALSRLKPIYREALTLRFIDNVSVADIADRLFISVKGAESRITRGLKQLAQSLGN